MPIQEKWSQFAYVAERLEAMMRYGGGDSHALALIEATMPLVEEPVKNDSDCSEFLLYAGVWAIALNDGELEVKCFKLLDGVRVSYDAGKSARDEAQWILENFHWAYRRRRP